MPIRSNRALVIGAISAITLLGLTGCAAGSGDNSAPANDQSSPEAVAKSYFQNIEHFDSTKLNAILGEDHQLNAKELTSLKKSVDLWGTDNPYSDFKVASVKERYENGNYDEAATVNYTYTYKNKLRKGNVEVAVDPSIDDSVWFIDSDTNFAPVGIDESKNIASSTLTINKQKQQVTASTRVFPGIPYDWQVTYNGGLVTPASVHTCGFLGEDGACVGSKTKASEIDTAKVTALVQKNLIARIQATCDNPARIDFANGDGSSTIQGDEKACTVADTVGYNGTGLDTTANKNAYNTYAASKTFYQPGSDPEITVDGDTDGFQVNLSGGSYKAYDFVENRKDLGIDYSDCTAFTCKTKYAYSYTPTWNDLTYDDWNVYLSGTGEIEKFDIPSRYYR